MCWNCWYDETLIAIYVFETPTCTSITSQRPLMFTKEVLETQYPSISLTHTLDCVIKACMQSCSQARQPPSCTMSIGFLHPRRRTFVFTQKFLSAHFFILFIFFWVAVLFYCEGDQLFHSIQCHPSIWSGFHPNKQVTIEYLNNSSRLLVSTPEKHNFIGYLFDF